jgi:AraC-like DNA-binding protein
MSLDNSDITLLRFSTSDLPERDRLSYWRELFGRQIAHVEVEPLSGLAFQADARVLALAGLRVMWANLSSDMYMRRTRQLLSDGDDSIGLVIKQSGLLNMTQRDRDVSLGIGDALSVLHADTAGMSTSQVDWLALIVPRAALVPFVADIESRAMRLIPRDSEPLRLLTKYVDILRGDPALLTPELRLSVVTHIHDLVAMTLGATRDGAAIASKRGVRAARLRAIMADILANLTNPELTVTAVALRQRVTPRYVHMLFEGEGTTFSEFVLNVRLVHAHRMLTNPRFAGWTITHVAFASGLGDLSYFDRTFRRRFGATPSDVRHGASRDQTGEPSESK